MYNNNNNNPVRREFIQVVNHPNGRDSNGNYLPLASQAVQYSSSTPQFMQSFMNALKSPVTPRPRLAFDEPTFFCMTCGQNIPVLHSKHHRAECYNSSENDNCPLCDRKRNWKIMETHILECGNRRGCSTYTTIETVLNYKSSPELIKRLVAGQQKRIVEVYGVMLDESKDQVFAPCEICLTRQEHINGVCLRMVGGILLEEAAFHAYDTQLLPRIEYFMDQLNDSKKEFWLLLFKLDWEHQYSGIPCDDEIITFAMRKCNKKYEAEKQNKIKKNKKELEQVIERNREILGDKLVLHRDSVMNTFRIRRRQFFENPPIL
ncbi:hypothetical protein CAEBREN_13146 [Caenorhabditis brenneri]|uniref:Uncharacterized protein n=1 Tax=Caenorhabditis brenneri TaxID=135651 RepID=G0N1T6_CAEBE|nr:hypothetical protein CAEBREN_13146 [Caenorhabditis brenneri]